MIRRFLPISLLATLCLTANSATEWHYPLYLARGGIWQNRVPIHVSNDMNREATSEPVAVSVGTGNGEADLVGHDAKAIRVCNADGEELLFNIRGSAGEQIRTGTIPDGSTLTIPAECPAGGTATHYAYFDNSKAWQVAKFLKARLGVANSGFEGGTGDTPSGWKRDTGDADHTTMWVDENPHSGDKCIKTVVSEGAEHTWIATRQRQLHIIGGARYRMTGWVRAKNVKARAGFYIHVGNPEDTMMIPSVPDQLIAGPGTYNWKKVSWEFKAPHEANLASLGTVLRGTGTAWYDDVKLQMLSDISLSASAGPVQQLKLNRTGEEAEWYDPDASDDNLQWPYRVPIRIVNPANQPIDNALMRVDTSSFTGRLHGRLNKHSLRLRFESTPVSYYQVGNTLLFSHTIPARTIKTYYLYFSEDPDIPPATESDFADLLASDHNLAKNPSFERGEKLPDDWPGGTEGTRPANAEMGLSQNALFGDNAARIHVPADSKPAWTGWRQKVPVQPNKHYLFAVWIRTENVVPKARIHAHYLDAEGNLCQTKGFTSMGPDLQGTKDWTMLSSIFTMPPDAAFFELHLTIKATGTVWHDGVILAPAKDVHAGSLQSRMQTQLAAPTAWPTNSVVKVFHTDLPPNNNPQTAHISAARNEKEPLQIAFRSPNALDNVQVSIRRPENAAGETLDDIEIGVVGYVPIDHKTSYYRSQAPTWHRMYPQKPGSCDGWAGMWPDPILPRSSFSVPPQTTQPVWITVDVPKDAAAGRYTGAVEFNYPGGSRSLPVEVRVFEFTIPDENHVSAIYTTRQRSNIWQIPDQTPRETLHQFWRFMADHRVCPSRVSPMPTFSYSDGEVSVDFTKFDKAAQYYFDELGFNYSYMPQLFYCFGWGHLPKKLWGVAPYKGEYPYEKADHSNLRPQYKKIYQTALRKFYNHIKQKGWKDKFVLYISDEPWEHRTDYVIPQMKACCDMIHAVDPDIPIYSSTWDHTPDWNGYIDVWGFGHYGRVTTETIKNRQAAGDTIWWTTDGQMCTDTPYCAIERLLPHYCFKYGADAYEFWGIDWLTLNPHQFGWHSYIHSTGAPGQSKWVRYPNGDGFLAYPGRPVGHDGPLSSLRLQQAREGVEDYEYLYMLRRRIRKAKKAGADVESQQATLNAAMKLVQRPAPIGRYSTKILPQPDRVHTVKQQLAHAIQKLAR